MDVVEAVGVGLTVGASIGTAVGVGVSVGVSVGTAFAVGAMANSGASERVGVGFGPPQATPAVTVSANAATTKRLFNTSSKVSVPQRPAHCFKIANRLRDQTRVIAGLGAEVSLWLEAESHRVFVEFQVVESRLRGLLHRVLAHLHTLKQRTLGQ